MLLLLANVAFFALVHEFFGRVIADGREPERLAQEIHPERVRVLAGGAEASSSGVRAVTPRTVACLEFGGFAPEDARRVESQLDAIGITTRSTVHRSEDQNSFMVYLPPFPNKAEADRASAELQRIGVNDFFIIQDAGPFKMAISLGVFRTEDAAKARLTALSQLGVRNAKSGERAIPIARNYYDLRNLDVDSLAKLNDLRAQQFPSQEFHDCPASPATAPASSSGT